MAIVIKVKEKNRCEWAGSEPLMLTYHDEEWGVPVHEDQELFEFIVLEGAQAGLSWSTILNRREGYKKAFNDFNIESVASFTEKDFEQLYQDPRIVRNKLKIRSAITNAQKIVLIQQEFGSFDEYIWGFVDHQPINNKFKILGEIPAYTQISTSMSKELKKRGFSFIGPTICYAFMQSIGMVNDHVINCFRYNEIVEMNSI